MAYNPNQPRVPAGNSNGGEWTTEKSALLTRGVYKGAGLEYKKPTLEEWVVQEFGKDALNKLNEKHGFYEKEYDKFMRVVNGDNDVFFKEDYIDVSDNEQKYSEILNKYKKADLSQDEIDSLRKYAGLKYQDINRACREGLKPKDKVGITYQQSQLQSQFDDILGLGNLEHDEVDLGQDEFDSINNIDSAILKSSGLPENIVLHRGFGSKEIYENIVSGNIQNGSTFKDSGFMSTSFENSVSEHFSDKQFPVLMKIYADAGAKGIFMQGENIPMILASEKEFVIPRNAGLEIISSSIVTDQHGRQIGYIEARYQ